MRRARNAKKKRIIRRHYQTLGFPYEKAKQKSFLREMDYYRGWPADGSLVANAWVLGRLGMAPADSDIISAYVLRWAQHGLVAFADAAGQNAGGFEAGSIVFKPLPGEVQARMEPGEARLHALLQNAAGANGVLEPAEIKAWAANKANERFVMDWKRALPSWQSQAATQRGILEQLTVGRLRGRSRMPLTEAVLSAKGVQQARELLGLKRYLLDFTLIHERMPPEVVLWGEYLVLASLLGIAEQVAEAFAQLYPRYFTVAQPVAMNYAVSVRLARNISRSAAAGVQTTQRRVQAAQARASAASGGRRSGGGGRGRGGGSRGGGSSSGGGGRGGGRR